MSSSFEHRGAGHHTTVILVAPRHLKGGDIETSTLQPHLGGVMGVQYLSTKGTNLSYPHR